MHELLFSVLLTRSAALACSETSRHHLAPFNEQTASVGTEANIPLLRNMHVHVEYQGRTGRGSGTMVYVALSGEPLYKLTMTMPQSFGGI
jgi:hypothetical protein